MSVDVDVHRLNIDSAYDMTASTHQYAHYITCRTGSIIIYRMSCLSIYVTVNEKRDHSAQKLNS